MGVVTFGCTGLEWSVCAKYFLSKKHHWDAIKIQVYYPEETLAESLAHQKVCYCH